MQNEINLNISKLVALYEAEKKRAESLATQLTLKEEEVHKYKEQITELNLQMDNLKLSKAFVSSSPDDKLEAKEAIGKLIREIDKCIKLLES